MAGYTVLEAAHGGEALSLATKQSLPIKLMITDVIMPILTGPQVAAKLLARYPELKVLYMSGYTDSLLAAHDEQDIRAAFLQKPFTPAGLLGAVQRLLVDCKS
jgi:CheY-like chemotaxis protein